MSKFGIFLNTLKLIEPPICNDVDIQGGWIRQRSNNHYFVFESDLTRFVGNISFSLHMIKDRIEELKNLNGSDVQILLPENAVEFTDKITKKSYPLNRNFIDNKFIPDEDEVTKIFRSLNEEQLILKHSFLTEETKSIKSVTKWTAHLTAVFNNNLVNLESKTPVSQSVHSKGIISLKALNGFCEITIDPFLISQVWELYLIEPEYVLSKFIVNDFTWIYGKSPLKKNPAESE